MIDKSSKFKTRLNRFYEGKKIDDNESEKIFNEIVFYIKRNPKKINKQDEHGTTLLMLAAKMWNKEMISFFKKNWADINLTNNFWLTPLIFAIKHYKQSHTNIATIESLINTKNINYQDEHWDTALMCAAGRWHIDIIQILKDWWADITIKNKKWETAITIANKKWDKNIIEILNSG